MTQRSSTLDMPLTLSPGPSRLLSVYLWTLHLVACLALLLVDWPLWMEVSVVLLLATSLIHYHRLHVLRTAGAAIHTAVWDKDGQWWVRIGANEPVSAGLQPDSYVTLGLVILNFKVGRWRKSLILTQESVDDETLRRLRVRLKLKYGQAETVS